MTVDRMLIHCTLCSEAGVALSERDVARPFKRPMVLPRDWRRYKSRSRANIVLCPKCQQDPTDTRNWVNVP